MAYSRLLHSRRYTEAIDAFLDQHAMLHTASLVSGYRWSFQDEVSADLTDEQWRQIPSGRLYTIAWLLWHIARTEDVTINHNTLMVFTTSYPETTLATT